MSSLFDLLTGQFGGTVLKQISSQLGADEDATKNAVPEVVGLLLGALANNTNDANGAEALSNALTKDHDGGILDDILGFLGNFQQGPGNGILSHIFGDNRATVEEKLSSDTGLDLSAISNLLTMVAPLVLGALGKAQKQDGLSAQGLAGLLQKERTQVQGADPRVKGALSHLLDAARLSAPTAEGRTEFYVVQKGDTLSKIALKFYGKGSRYPEIFEANRDILKNPDLIYPGQKLRIPNVTK